MGRGRGQVRSQAGCAVASGAAVYGPVIPHLSEAVQVARDRQLLNRWQMSPWAVDGG